MPHKITDAKWSEFKGETVVIPFRKMHSNKLQS